MPEALLDEEFLDSVTEESSSAKGLASLIRSLMVQINVRRGLLAAGIRQLCDAEFSCDISMVLKGLTTLQTGTASQSAEFKQ